MWLGEKHQFCILKLNHLPKFQLAMENGVTLYQKNKGALRSDAAPVVASMALCPSLVIVVVSVLQAALFCANAWILLQCPSQKHILSFSLRSV